SQPPITEVIPNSQNTISSGRAKADEKESPSDALRRPEPIAASTFTTNVMQPRIAENHPAPLTNRAGPGAPKVAPPASRKQVEPVPAIALAATRPEGRGGAPFLVLGVTFMLLALAGLAYYARRKRPAREPISLISRSIENQRGS